MPLPNHCHICDKPTMNENGICDHCNGVNPEEESKTLILYKKKKPLRKKEPK